MVCRRCVTELLYSFRALGDPPVFKGFLFLDGWVLRECVKGCGFLKCLDGSVSVSCFLPCF